MSCNWSILLVLLLFIIHTGSSISNSSTDCNCNDPNALNAQTCDTLFKTFEDALLNNGSNLYKLRKLFLTSPPELVHVTYFLEFNSSGDSCGELSNGGTGSACLMEQPFCLMGACGNSTYFNRTTGTVPLQYGWTRIGVYTLIHPALLNLLQIQLPFAIMRLHVNDTSFLWNGQNELPSINLHLSISTNDMCIPSDSQMDGVMKSLTSLVKVQYNYSYRHNTCIACDFTLY